METEVLGPGAREEAGELWRGLEARLGGVRLAVSWDWTETWLEHFGDLLAHRFVVARREGEVRGLALLTEARHHRRGPMRLRTLHLGCAGEPQPDTVSTPYNGVLAAPGDLQPFAAEVLAVADADRRWDELRLDGLAEADARAFAAADPGAAVARTPCPARDLDAVRAAGATAAEAMPRRVRQGLRRSERETGTVTGRLARTAGEALDVLEELAELHQERWEREGQVGAFASERFSGFQRALVPRLLERDAVVLLRASGARRTVGCILGYVEQDRVLSYQGGFSRFDDPRVKPGFLTHVLCMQRCLERGLGRYDLLAGDSTYKRELTDAEDAQADVRVTRRRVRLAPVVLARQVRDRVRA